MAAATAFDALDRSQPRASQCGYSLMNLWCGLSPLLAKSRPPAAGNRSLLYPQERTFSWPRLTSGFDPEQSSSNL